MLNFWQLRWVCEVQKCAQAEAGVRALIDQNERNLSQAKENKLRVDEQIKQIDLQYQEEVQQIKVLESELFNIKSQLDHLLQAKSDLAFTDYLQKQQNTFDQLSKTYGNRASQTIKQEHKKQFIDIMKFNQQKVFEKFKNLSKELDSLDDSIKRNVDYVD